MFENLKRILPFVISPGPRYILRLQILADVFEELFQSPIKKIAELGPGNGDLSHYLADKFSNKEFYLFEPSRKANDILKTRFSSVSNAEVNSHTLRSGAVKEEAKYDLIMAFEVLEHIENDSHLISEVANSLSDEGYFVLSVPAYMRKWQLQDIVAGHIRRYEEKELLFKLENEGFEVQELLDYGFPLTSILRPIRFLFYFLKSRTKNSKLERTHDSGVSNRALSEKYNRAVFYTLYPFYFLQTLSKNWRFGDGFIVVARKVSDK